MNMSLNFGEEQHESVAPLPKTAPTAPGGSVPAGSPDKGRLGAPAASLSLLLRTHIIIKVALCLILCHLD